MAAVFFLLLMISALHLEESTAVVVSNLTLPTNFYQPIIVPGADWAKRISEVKTTSVGLRTQRSIWSL